MKFALITGISGQDGSYLTEFLLTKKYKIYGIIRRSSYFNTKRIDHLQKYTTLFYGDVIDSGCILNILNKIKDNMSNDDILEIYNLAAQSHVKVSFELPSYTGQVDALGTLNILESIRISGLSNRCLIKTTSIR